MTIAYIIAVYKDVEALSLIIDTILEQSVFPDEVIIAEDGNSKEISQYVESLNIDAFKIIHTFHEDIGWQKDKSLNNAIRSSNSEYLIITDGDIVPYPNFVEMHKKLASPKSVLCGRRVNPGPLISKKLRQREMSVKEFSENYFLNTFQFFRDGMTRYDDGIQISPDGWLFKKLDEGKRKNSSLIGCCWSVWREDLEMINGFDEDFQRPTVGCDTDIERRLRHFGIAFKSCRNVANSIHLYHKEKYDKVNSIENKKILASKKDIYICKNGLKKL